MVFNIIQFFCLVLVFINGPKLNNGADGTRENSENLTPTVTSEADTHYRMTYIKEKYKVLGLGWDSGASYAKPE